MYYETSFKRCVLALISFHLKVHQIWTFVKLYLSYEWVCVSGLKPKEILIKSSIQLNFADEKRTCEAEKTNTKIRNKTFTSTENWRHTFSTCFVLIPEKSKNMYHISLRILCNWKNLGLLPGGILAVFFDDIQNICSWNKTLSWLNIPIPKKVIQ